MGTFYVDRANFDVGGSLKVDGRNIIGKMLNDQSFSPDLKFLPGTLDRVIARILQDASVTKYHIQESPINIQVSFKPEATILQAIQELLKLEPTWEIAEDADGTIIVGDPNEFFYFKNMFSKFELDRDSLISRRITRDDNDVYSRVIVYCVDDRGTTSKHAEINHVYDWQNIPNKTKFLKMPDDTSEGRLQSTANMLAGKYAKVGISNELEKSFTPYIVPRDAIDIIQDNKRYDLGLITDVTHNFGRSGFLTSFISDSAGLRGEDTIKGLLGQEEPSGNIEIINR